MAKIIEAKVVISGEEKLSPLIDKLAKKLSQIEKNKKTAEAVDKMSAALARANKQMAAMDKFAAARGGFEKARAHFRETQIAVERAAKAMQTANGPTAALAANYRKAQNAVIAASSAFERQKSAVLAAKRSLEGMGGSINNIAGQQRKLEAAVNRANAAIDRQHRRANRRANIGNAVVGAVGATALGYRARSFAGQSITSAAEFDYAVRKQRLLTEGDISKADQAEILIPQAKRIGQETRFTNLDVVQAQTASMQGLPTAITGRQRAQVGAGMMENIRNYAIIMETDLKQAAETVRTYLQQTGKDISTPEKAVRESRLAVNRIARMAKLGGMSAEDVPQYLRYGAGANSVVGVSEDAFLAIGALAKRGGLQGEETGVFMRQVAGKLAAPTKKGLTAMRAAGIDYNKFVNMPSKLDAGGLEAQFQQELGVKFTSGVRDRLSGLLADKNIIGDRNTFTEAVSKAVEPLFPTNKKGAVSAAHRKQIAKAAGDFYKFSAGSVDAQGLLDALMMSNLSLAQINSIFDYRQGGRFAITQRQREEYSLNRKAIRDTDNDPDFAKSRADEIMAGLGGALENIKGSFENLQQALGEANAALLKFSFDTLGKGFDWIANLSEGGRQAATALASIGVLGGSALLLKQLFSGFGLASSAAALDGAAAALTVAATRLGAGGAIASGAPAASAAASPWLARLAPAAPYLGLAGGALGGAAALYGLRQYVEGEGYAGKTVQERLASQGGGSMRDVRIRAFNEERARMGLPLLGGDRPVEAELKGEAKVSGKAEVTINIPGFGVHSAMIPLSGTMSANGPGSLGTSSPDAAAMPVGGP